MGNEKINFSFWAIVNKVFFLTLGALVAAFAIECFLVPNNIIDGGIVGISIILNHFFDKSTKEF